MMEYRDKNNIQTKQDFYKGLKKNSDILSFESYKLAKKEATITVQDARPKLYKEVYKKLDTKEAENDNLQNCSNKREKTYPRY